MARIVKDSKDKLIKDFHSVISDTEELMKSVSNESGGDGRSLAHQDRREFEAG